MVFINHGTASAAEISVSGSCSIDQAITSANNDADAGGCAGVGAYGDDIINIPAGVWPRNSVVAIEGNTRIAGAGIGQTIIDGVNAYEGLICGDSNDTVFDLEVSDLSITGFGGAFGDSGIRADDCNTTISRVEISDWTSLTNNGAAIRIRAESANDISADLTDIYIHDGVVRHWISCPTAVQ